MTTTTTFENKCAILAEFWLEYKNDDEFQDFIEYSDIGLPLAYAISTGIINTTELATGFVDETFDLLLDAVGVPDEGFETLQDILIRSNPSE